jgi:hypothetical protein
MTPSATDAIATLRIEIKYIEPLIWRRIAVRTSMNLMALHKVSQPQQWVEDVGNSAGPAPGMAVGH